jgi:hypothetical protein
MAAADGAHRLTTGADDFKLALSDDELAALVGREAAAALGRPMEGAQRWWCADPSHAAR